MGDNTLTTQADLTIISSDHINQYKSALAGDVVPRLSSGVATTLEGSLGTDSLKWLKAHIASGYWDIGDIKPHHSFNGAAAIGQGWFPCDGTIINETNYDAIHGAGAWDTYVITSALDGKYSPNLTDKYLVGASSTSQDGSSAITSTGNTGNQIDFSHTHVAPEHNHKWYNFVSGGSDEQSYDIDGNQSNISGSSASGTGLLTGNAGNTLDQDYFTSNEGDSATSSSLSATQNIQPESIQVIYYIRII